MINVVHIIPDLPPCGAEMVVMTYLRKFKDDPDFKVSAISLSKNQHRLYEQSAEEEKLDITYLGQNIHDNGLIVRVRQILQLHRILKALKPDVIHIHLSILWMVCLAAKGVGSKKLFHTLHSDPEKTSYGKHIYVDRSCYKFFKVRTMALNEEMAIKADRLFHLNNTLVMRNGIDLGSYKNQPREKLRAQFGILEGVFVLGHVGRFNKVKNHHKIIEVFHALKLKHSQSKLLLVGDGEDMTKVKEQVENLNLTEDVIFTGARKDVPAMMSMMDCFIFPSFYEGLGIVLLEAQAAGLRCVVSDTIPTETTVTGNVFRIPLSLSSSDWADAALGRGCFKSTTVQRSLKEYDINNIIETLKGYYLYE